MEFYKIGTYEVAYLKTISEPLDPPDHLISQLSTSNTDSQREPMKCHSKSEIPKLSLKRSSK